MLNVQTAKLAIDMIDLVTRRNILINTLRNQHGPVEGVNMTLHIA